MGKHNHHRSIVGVFIPLMVMTFGSTLCAYGADPASPALSVTPEHSEIRVDQPIVLNVTVRDVKDLYGAPFYVHYDPDFLKVVGVREGLFLKGNQMKTVFFYKIEQADGKVIVGLTRLGKVAGVDGTGILAALTFKAVRAGRTSVSLDKTDFRDSHQNGFSLKTHRAGILIREKLRPHKPRLIR